MSNKKQCNCDIPFSDCPNAMETPHGDKWYCTLPQPKGKMIEAHLQSLTPEQIDQHKKFGHEFYFEPETGKMEFSQVRTNMMEDRYYTPYCIPCPGLQRFGQMEADGQMTCPICKNRTEFDSEFIERFKTKHGLK